MEVETTVAMVVGAGAASTFGCSATLATMSTLGVVSTFSFSGTASSDTVVDAPFFGEAAVVDNGVDAGGVDELLVAGGAELRPDPPLHILASSVE